MAADPISTAFSMLYGVLTGDATFAGEVTGVYQVFAPSGSTPDYCLIAHQSGQDVLSAIGTRIMTTMLFQVKVVGPETDAANLRTAFARLDALLQPAGLPLRNQSGTLACYREQAFNIGEIVNGALWYNIGGLYRVEVA